MLTTTLFRSYGYRHPLTADWQVVVQGRRFYETLASTLAELDLAKRLLLRGLLKRLQLPIDALTDPQFGARIAGFLAGATPGERIRLRIAEQPHSLRRPTGKSGLFYDRIGLGASAFAGEDVYCDRSAARGGVWLQTDGAGAAGRGEVFLADTRGINVITDIDDTIKLTEVHSRERMLARTFVDPFEPIDGMADLYRQWGECYPILFQYVSSSPWQLYSPLQSFLDEHNFPTGSMHLRWFTLKGELLRKSSVIRRRGKSKVIGTLIDQMPSRRFFLIGDSGESDPEIYAALARRHPESVAAVAIRDLPHSPLSGARLRAVQAVLGGVPLRVFREPAEIADLIERFAR